MKGLLHTIKWDFILVVKYGIVMVMVVLALIYCIALLFMDTRGMEKLVSFFIFSDPVMYGFIFTAVMVLFEKDEGTQQVLAVTTMPVSRYIWSKVIVFTFLSLLYSAAVILSAQPRHFNPFSFIIGVLMSSSLFVCIGIVGVSYVKNFNQFILLMPVVLAPVCLPLLDFFSICHSVLFYVLPTQASLLLFKSAVGEVYPWQMAYAIIYLVICNILFFRLACKLYQKRILNISLHE